MLCCILRHLAPSQVPSSFATHTHTQRAHTHTHTQTHTSSISQDKLGFCDFLQIPLQIRENNLKALNRQRHEPLWKLTGKRKKPTCTYKSQSCQALVCRRDDWLQHHPVILHYFWFLHTSMALLAESHLSHSRGRTPWYHRGRLWKCDNVPFWRGSHSAGLSLCSRNNHCGLEKPLYVTKTHKLDHIVCLISTFSFHNVSSVSQLTLAMHTCKSITVLRSSVSSLLVVKSDQWNQRKYSEVDIFFEVSL